MCSLRLAKFVLIPDNPAKTALGNTLLSLTGIFLAYFEVDVKQCNTHCRRVIDEFYPCGKRCCLGSLKAIVCCSVSALRVMTGSIWAGLIYLSALK